jgi:hypothetical protein
MKNFDAMQHIKFPHHEMMFRVMKTPVRQRAGPCGTLAA